MDAAIQVLLSTYNGARHLEPQLESLLQQTYSNMSILIRDDGSHDETPDLLTTYSHRHKNIHWIAGENRGVVGSFFDLIQMADNTVRFFAFCDQDDIWEQHKIERAISHLTNFSEHIPLLYASCATLVDNDLNTLGVTPVPQKPLGLCHALVQNRLIGNTMVFNAAARNLILAHIPDFKNVAMHDWWVYLVVGTFGKVIFDYAPQVRYRQHEQNVVGDRSESLSARLKRFRQNKRPCTRQAAEFQRCYTSILNDSQRKIINRFLNERSTIWQRIRYALSPDVYRQTTLDNLILRCLILLNRV